MKGLDDTARLLRLGLTLLLVLALGPAAMRSAAQAPPESPDLDAIDEFVETEMDRHRIHGLALAIVHDGEVLHVRGYGRAGGGRPVTPGTPFYLGSVTKSITALAVMQLVEAGRLELDRPVHDYLPWFGLADEEAAAQITVRHLLNQTSGLSRASDPGASLAPGASMEEAVRALAAARPTAPVGTQFQYFNPNYTILGLLIQAVTGRSYGDYLATGVLAPLGMDRTFTSRAAAEEAGLAQGYNVFFGWPLARRQPHLDYDLPAGFVISTAEDMAHYLIAQLTGRSPSGGRLISVDALALMHRPPAGVDSPYAMGWEVQAWDGLRLVRHDGSLQTFYASAVLLPEEGYGLALLANQVSSPHMALAYEELVRGIAGRLAGREAGTGLSTTALYLGLLALAAISLALQVRSLLRLGRWRRQIAGRGRARALLGTLCKVGFGLLVLLVVPWLLVRGSGLSTTRVLLFNYLPGVTLWLGLMAVLSLLEGIVRASILWRAR